MSGKENDDDFDWLYDATKQPQPPHEASEEPVGDAPLPVGDWQPAPRRRWLRAMAVVAGLAILSGGGKLGYDYVTTDNHVAHTPSESTSPTVPLPSSSHPASPAPSPTTSPAIKPSATPRTQAECIADLPLAFKLGQKIMIGATADTLSDAGTVAARYHIGGIILMDQAPASAVQALQRKQLVPMLVATDQEGGTVQRYKNEGLLPAAADVPGALTPAQYQTRIAADDAYLRRQGITMNFAPVADVAPLSGTSVLGSRIFSSDPAVVTNYVRADVRAGLANGVLPTLKHFPGLGSASRNTDYGPATTPSFSQLQIRDLVPYQRLVSESVAVMVGNQTVPGLTNGLPASLSYAAITGELRGTLGYRNNVVITDSLSAKAITDSDSITTASVKSWEAGSDIALFVTPMPGETLAQQIDHIITLGKQAVQAGQLSKSAVDASVGRLFALPQKQTDACRLDSELQ